MHSRNGAVGGLDRRTKPGTLCPGAGNEARHLAGSFKVATAAPAQVTITPAVSGGNLTLAWPAGQTGWTLQEQTNPLTVGISTNWVAEPSWLRCSGSRPGKARWPARWWECRTSSRPCRKPAEGNQSRQAPAESGDKETRANPRKAVGESPRTERNTRQK